MLKYILKLKSFIKTKRNDILTTNGQKEVFMMKNKKGFTLSEVLVTVLIIGIISSFAVPQYMTIVQKTKIAAQLPLASSISESVIRYFSAKNEAPSTLAKLSIQLPPNFEIEGKTATSEKPNCYIMLSVEQDEDGYDIPKDLTYTCQTTTNLGDWNFRFEYIDTSSGIAAGKRYFQVLSTDATTKSRLNKAAKALGWQQAGEGENADVYEMT